jgi:CheY-like chemotaxis protein
MSLAGRFIGALELSTSSVLVIEDEPSAREALCELINVFGFEAIPTQNGWEALKYLHSCDNLPRLILLDLVMPIMTGLEFRQAQMRDTLLAQIPVIVLTASNPSEWGDLDRTTVMRKPVDILELSARVREQCAAA